MNLEGGSRKQPAHYREKQAEESTDSEDSDGNTFEVSINNGISGSQGATYSPINNCIVLVPISQQATQEISPLSVSMQSTTELQAENHSQSGSGTVNSTEITLKKE